MSGNAIECKWREQPAWPVQDCIHRTLLVRSPLWLDRKKNTPQLAAPLVATLRELCGPFPLLKGGWVQVFDMDAGDSSEILANHPIIDLLRPHPPCLQRKFSLLLPRVARCNQFTQVPGYALKFKARAKRYGFPVDVLSQPSSAVLKGNRRRSRFGGFAPRASPSPGAPCRTRPAPHSAPRRPDDRGGGSRRGANRGRR